MPDHNDNSETVSMENLLKASIGAILGACMLCCLVLAAIVMRQRKCKVRKQTHTIHEIIRHNQSQK